MSRDSSTANSAPGVPKLIEIPIFPETVFLRFSTYVCCSTHLFIALPSYVATKRSVFLRFSTYIFCSTHLFIALPSYVATKRCVFYRLDETVKASPIYIEDSTNATARPRPNIISHGWPEILCLHQACIKKLPDPHIDVIGPLDHPREQLGVVTQTS
ncbi:hypothetical protein JB92DRAFT_371372 [Gautieria morchelliformis]|nr:hypothetical protein JB92DRAFT_371372 [Gautieria morchelliformis]